MCSLLLCLIVGPTLGLRASTEKHCSLTATPGVKANLEKSCRLEITHRKVAYFYVHKSGKLAMAEAKRKAVRYTLQWATWLRVHGPAFFDLDHFVEINPVSVFQPLVIQCQQATATVIIAMRKPLCTLKKQNKSKPCSVIFKIHF